jgi:hypothetical protein
MSEYTSLELHLTGQNLSPGSIRSKDLAELITAVEEMVAAQIIHEHPKIKKESISVGLENIVPGSIGLQFKPNDSLLTSSAALRITEGIKAGKFNQLPNATLQPLRIISAFAKRHHCNAEFYERNGQAKLLAVITPELEIPETVFLKGETTLYGKVLRAGGADENHPRIQVRTITGQLIYCQTTKKLAKIAAQKLYEQIGLVGTAQWDSETLEIESFFAEKIDDYEDQPITDSFDELSQRFGSQFDAIKDVAAYCDQLRYG